MSGAEQSSTSSFAESRGENHDQSSDSLPGRLSQEQLRRWAVLVAKGETGFPEDLNPDDCDLLLGHCRVLLRDRLVCLVARAIALDIHRDGGQNRKA